MFTISGTSAEEADYVNPWKDHGRIINQLFTKAINNMSFKIHQGKIKTQWLPVTPSTDLTKDTLLTFSSGKLVAATAGTTAVNLVGTLGTEIATTDDNYADDRLVPVNVPIEKHCVWEADVTSGLVATDIGGEFDLTDAATVNRGASSIDAVKCVGRISATKGYFLVKINGSY